MCVCLPKENLNLFKEISPSRTITFDLSLQILTLESQGLRYCRDGVSVVLISQTAPSEAKPNFPRIRSWQTNDMLISVPTCSRLQLLVGQNPLAEVLRFCDSAVFRKTCQRFSHTHFHSWSQLNPARRLALSVLVWLDPGFGIYKIAQVVPGTEIQKPNRNRQVSLELPGPNMSSWSQFNAR